MRIARVLLLSLFAGLVGCASTPPPKAEPAPAPAPTTVAEPCDSTPTTEVPEIDGRCPIEVGEAEADPFAE